MFLMPLDYTLKTVKVVNFMLDILPWASQVMLVVKNLLANAGDIRDLGSILGLGRSPRGGHGNPLQYSCLENSMDRGTWWTIVHRVAELDRTESI